MIDLKRKENCTGCKACGDICPKGAISFQTDKEGFWYPEVDPSKCVDCHLFVKFCPVLNLIFQKKDITLIADYYDVVNKDLPVRLDSTSGGAFSLLANQVFQAGGYVGGAVYSGDFHVHHFLTDNPADLERLRGIFPSGEEIAVGREKGSCLRQSLPDGGAPAVSGRR